MKVEGLKNLQNKMQQEVNKRLASPNATAGKSVVVGYTAAYAVYVHENLEAAHGTAYNAKYAAEISQGQMVNKKGRVVKKKGWKGRTSRGPEQQAKFLEQPARELSNSGELSQDVVNAMRAGSKLQDAVLVAAEHIQQDSQQLVPVDTGNLRGSAFVQKE